MKNGEQLDSTALLLRKGRSLASMVRRHLPCPSFFRNQFRSILASPRAPWITPKAFPEKENITVLRTDATLRLFTSVWSLVSCRASPRALVFCSRPSSRQIDLGHCSYLLLHLRAVHDPRKLATGMISSCVEPRTLGIKLSSAVLAGERARRVEAHTISLEPNALCGITSCKLLHRL